MELWSRPAGVRAAPLALALFGQFGACTGNIVAQEGIAGGGAGSEAAGESSPSSQAPRPAPGGGQGSMPGAGTGPQGPAPAPASPASACATESPGAPSLRRLSAEELDRSLTTLLGRPLTMQWPQDEQVAGYASARDNQMLEPHARSLYTTLLPELRKTVDTGLPGLAPECTAADATCAAALVQGFAARAFRRATTPDERTSLLAFYDQVKQELDAKEATAHLLLAILSSPSFLYRGELGTAGGKPERKLSSREIATATSYFFWGQPPDATALAKVDADRLQSEAEILDEIDRLRASPRYADWMQRFFQQWTHVQNLDQHDHALDKYPSLTKPYEHEAELAYLQQFSAVFGKPSGTYEELVSSRTMVAGPLTAMAYQAGAKPSALSPMEADPGRRGVFMSVGSLTAYSKPDRPAEISRARFFLDQVVCRDLPGIPADALQRMFTPDPAKSPRQNFEGFTGGTGCVGCHSMLNPIGYSFDRFGADGQILTQLDGFPIDTQGTIQGAGEVDGQIAGPEDFILKVAKSRDARLCFLKQLYRFGNGRKETDLDRCTLDRLVGTMMDQEGDSLATFARHYFTSRNFLYRQDRGAP